VSTSNGINYSRINAINTDFSQGGMKETGRNLDVAIGGSGFFQVRKGAEVFYTRQGHLYLDEDGMMKTADGYNVMSDGGQPLQLIGAEGKEIEIDESGNISINGVPTGEKLQVYTVADEQQLTPQGYSLFKLDEGAVSEPTSDAQVVQGSLETSNVNMVEEISAMIDTQRKYETYIKALESYSTLSEKQNELGSIG